MRSDMGVDTITSIFGKHKPLVLIDKCFFCCGICQNSRVSNEKLKNVYFKGNFLIEIIMSVNPSYFFNSYPACNGNNSLFMFQLENLPQNTKGYFR